MMKCGILNRGNTPLHLSFVFLICLTDWFFLLGFTCRVVIFSVTKGFVNDYVVGIIAVLEFQLRCRRQEK